MPPATKRYPLLSISTNVPQDSQHSPKPHECRILNRPIAIVSPFKSVITVLNAKPALSFKKELVWHVSDSSRPPSSPQSTSQNPAVSAVRICSQSLSSLIPGLQDAKVQNRLRALQKICSAGRILQFHSSTESECFEALGRVDDHISQAAAALHNFELHGGCAAIIELLKSEHEGICCGALMGLALLCAVAPATFCARVCSEGGLIASILTMKRPFPSSTAHTYNDKCILNLMGLLLNCSSHLICHPSFCEKEICVTLLHFCVPWQNEREMQLANYACSAVANLCGGDVSTRKYLILNYSPHLKRLLSLVEKGCSNASLAIKNLCCCCSSLECERLTITGCNLIRLLLHLLPFSDVQNAENIASALQSYCLHSPLHPEQVQLLVKTLPRAGVLRSSLLAALCNSTLHRECSTSC